MALICVVISFGRWFLHWAWNPSELLGVWWAKPSKGGDLMIRSIAAVALTIALGLGGVSAANASEYEPSHKYCSGIENIARKVMIGRQAGIPISSWMEDPQILLEEIVVAAYEKPRFKSKGAQKWAVDEFTNQWYLRCFKGLTPL